MKLIVRTAAALAAVVFLAFAVFFAVGPQTVWLELTGPPDMGRYDFEDLQRSATSNDALACSPSLCGDGADIELPAYSETPSELITRLDAGILSTPGSVQRVDDRSEPAYARYVTHSPWMAYPDTTDIEAIDIGNGKSGIRAYARAKIGQKDFGANAERLREWLK